MKKYLKLQKSVKFIKKKLGGAIFKILLFGAQCTNFTQLLFKNSVITNKNFEETWTSVIDFVDDSFFKIENLEKDSGLLTLSFGSKEAENFIDCGDFEYTLFFTGEEFKGSYIDYAKRSLIAVLEAKMDVNIQKMKSIGQSIHEI